MTKSLGAVEPKLFNYSAFQMLISAIRYVDDSHHRFELANTLSEIHTAATRAKEALAGIAPDERTQESPLSADRLNEANPELVRNEQHFQLRCTQSNSMIAADNKEGIVWLLIDYLSVRRASIGYSLESDTAFTKVNYDIANRKWVAKSNSGFMGTLVQYWRNFVDAMSSRNTRMMTAAHLHQECNLICEPNKDKTAIWQETDSLLLPYEQQAKLGGTLGMIFQFSAHAAFPAESGETLPKALSTEQKNQLRTNLRLNSNH